MLARGIWIAIHAGAFGSLISRALRLGRLRDESASIIAWNRDDRTLSEGMMRKDVERLNELYPRPGSEQGSDLKRLGWPNARDLAARYATLLSPIISAATRPSGG